MPGFFNYKDRVKGAVNIVCRREFPVTRHFTELIILCSLRLLGWSRLECGPAHASTPISACQ